MVPSSSSDQRVAVVTGISSGIGYETSLMLTRNGFLTYATMRNPEKGKNLKSLAEKEKSQLRVVKLDVTDDGSVKDAIESIITEASRIDVLVNNAVMHLMVHLKTLQWKSLRLNTKPIFLVLRE